MIKLKVPFSAMSTHHIGQPISDEINQGLKDGFTGNGSAVGMKAIDAAFMQYRLPVGCGPSLKTAPQPLPTEKQQ